MNKNEINLLQNVTSLRMKQQEEQKRKTEHK